MAYNGHPSWAYWNVSLWIANDEGLYRLADACVKETRSLGEAAKLLYSYLEGEKTPDGAAYSLASIRHALRDWH